MSDHNETRDGMNGYNAPAEVDAEARALIAKHGPNDPAVMLTTDEMWAVLTEATPTVRDYLLGHWGDGLRCLIMNHDGELERLRAEREQIRAIAADYGEHPTATSRAEGCTCLACEKFHGSMWVTGGPRDTNG